MFYDTLNTFKCSMKQLVEAQIDDIMGNILLKLHGLLFVDINISVQTRKQGNILFNNALNTFYLRLYGVGHMVKDHSDSERGNLLPRHGLLFPISSKGSFICIIPQTG